MPTNPVTSIRLRAMEPEDLDMLYRIENDRELWGVGSTNVPYSRFTLHDYIANARGDIYADRQVRLIIETDDGVPVGIVDLVNFDPRHRRAEVGIVVEKPYRRLGIATMAMQKMAEHSLRVFHLHQLYGLASEGNEASLRLFRKLGFKQGGTLIDWLYDGKEYQNAVLMQLFL